MLLITLISASLTTGACLAETSSQLEQLKLRYAEELATTGAESKTYLSDLQANYLLSLEHYDSERRKAGDLEAMIAIREETVRMKREGTVSVSDVVREPVGLAALQMRYIRSVAKHAGEMGVDRGSQGDRSGCHRPYRPAGKLGHAHRCQAGSG